jgi:FAD/FMN-containing dehydrogenase
VFNLSVARVPVFTIGTRGLIVHNCYDEVGFALSAHSRVTTEKDRVNEELMELARELGGVVSDPYAVRRRRA